jgi:hypothetical protein
MPWLLKSVGYAPREDIGSGLKVCSSPEEAGGFIAKGSPSARLGVRGLPYVNCGSMVLLFWPSS